MERLVKIMGETFVSFYLHGFASGMCQGTSRGSPLLIWKPEKNPCSAGNLGIMLRIYSLTLPQEFKLTTLGN